MAGSKRIPTFLLFAFALLSQAGCVALNIPSERYHDPTDSGGLLGGWTGKPSHHPVHHLGDSGGDINLVDQFHGSSESCIDGDCLPMDPCDDCALGAGKPKPPKIPWPRFHPVPTRPVFGAPQLETL